MTALLAEKTFRLGTYFILNLVLANLVSSENYSQVNFLLLIITMVSVSTNFNAEAHYIKWRKANNNMRLVHLISFVFIIKVSLILLIIILSSIINIAMYTLLIPLAVIFLSIFNFIIYEYLAYQDFTALAWKQITSIIAAASIRIIILLYYFDVNLYIASYAIEPLILSILSINKYRFKLHGNLRLKKRMFVAIIRKLLPNFIGQTVNLIYGKLDILILTSFLPATVLAKYFMATKMIDLLANVGEAYSRSVYHRLLAEISDEERLVTRWRQIFRLGLLLSLLSMIFVIILTYVLEVHFLNNDFKNLSILTMILCFTCFSFYLGPILSNILIIHELQKYGMYRSIVSVCTAGLLNISLIPLLGIYGAAVATSFTSILSTFIYPMLFSQTRNLGMTQLSFIWSK